MTLMSTPNRRNDPDVYSSQPHCDPDVYSSQLHYDPDVYSSQPHYDPDVYSSQPHYDPDIYSTCNRKEYQKINLDIKARPMLKADIVTAICEPIAYSMWDSQYFTTL
jgi:hypothetical protein